MGNQNPAKRGHPMAAMVQTPSSGDIHPQDFVRRLRWAAVVSPRPR
jgi:hypothetical protein